MRSGSGGVAILRHQAAGVGTQQRPSARQQSQQLPRSQQGRPLLATPPPQLRPQRQGTLVMAGDTNALLDSQVRRCKATRGGGEEPAQLGLGSYLKTLRYGALVRHGPRAVIRPGPRMPSIGGGVDTIAARQGLRLYWGTYDVQ